MPFCARTVEGSGKVSSRAPPILCIRRGQQPDSKNCFLRVADRAVNDIGGTFFSAARI